MSSELMDLPPCRTCGTRFENIFEAVYHVAADLDDDAPVFDPRCYDSKGGYLKVGQLLEELWYHAIDPSDVRYMVERTYANLVSNSNYSVIAKSYVDSVLINEDMKGIDEEYKALVTNGEDKNDNRS